jgi:TolA-binding protein
LENRNNDIVEPVNSPDLGREPKETGGLKKLFIPVALAVAVCFAYVNILVIPTLVTKADDAKGLQTLDARINEVKQTALGVTDATNLVKEANKEITALKTSLSSSQNTIANLQNEIISLKSKPSADLTTVNTQITELQNKIKELTTKAETDATNIKTLQDKVTALQTGTTNPSVTGLVTAEITANGQMPTSFTTANPTTATAYQIPFKMKVTNGTSKQINNLQLYISLTNYVATGSMTGTATLSTISGSMAWNTYLVNTNAFYFTNTNLVSWANNNINIPANTTKTYTLIYTFTPTAGQIGGIVQVIPDIAPISADDYEIN